MIVLTDTLYLPGTKRLIESWDTHNPPLPLIALSADPTALENPFLKARCTRRIHVDPKDYDTIKPYKKRYSQRHGQTFYKFEAFSNFGYERNIFLDSDILCLRPAPDLLASSAAQLQAALDTGFRKTRAYKGHPNEINTGVLVIDKAIQGTATITQLKQIAQDNPGRSGYNSGDQGIINKWIHANSIDLQLLSSDYNRIKKDYANTTHLETTSLLHYAARKPWFEKTNHPLEALEVLWHEIQ